MNSKTDLFEYVMENEVKFVKLTFCDLLGRQRNISVLSSQLEDAFENGVAIDSGAITGVGGKDLKIVPVGSLLSVLPWRPHAGRVVSVFCRIANPDGTPFVCDPMALLQNEVDKLSALGYQAKVATECEFYVFKDDVGNNLVPFDNADYCACSPFDKCENLRRDVIVSLEDMGLKPISSHHERGWGQNEVDFESADPTSAARNFIMFKTAVKNVCAINGTYASFMPRPVGSQPGSGLHLTITLNGKNSDAASKAFAEGVLRRYREISCFANPTQNSYRRLRSGFQIAYSADRGSAMRIFDNNDIMLRTPDSTCNIFTVLALIFAAGREGIENKYTLRKEREYTDCMFSSIDRSLDFAEKSEWLRKYIPGVFDDVLGSIKRRAVAEQALKTDWELFEFHADI
ncbi:MAG: glutamine synthetase family protein [Clostridiales bacterium]|nr:glutamine synthetase family protein [Clostridiales bacterium]